LIDTAIEACFAASLALRLSTNESSSATGRSKVEQHQQKKKHQHQPKQAISPIKQQHLINLTMRNDGRNLFFHRKIQS
jgi:hypothetical protein